MNQYIDVDEIEEMDRSSLLPFDDNTLHETQHIHIHTWGLVTIAASAVHMIRTRIQEVFNNVRHWFR